MARPMSSLRHGSPQCRADAPTDRRLARLARGSLLLTVLAALLVGTLAARPAHALEDLTAFADVQTDCVALGAITLGANARYATCSVTKGRWFSTIGFTDLYQAQYCLDETGDEGCGARALLLFTNRAYKPVARLVLQRVDPGATEYDDPQVLKTADGYLMAITARSADGSSTSYYRWRGERWEPLPAPSEARVH